MGLKKINSNIEKDSVFEWLEADKNNGLWDSQLTEVVRVLIKKHDDMVDHINKLEEKFIVEQHAP